MGTLTHGEQWYEKKIATAVGDFDLDTTPQNNPKINRMKRKEANIFYQQRCKDVFKKLGMVKDKVMEEFEERFMLEFAITRKKTEAMLIREGRKIVRSDGWIR